MATYGALLRGSIGNPGLLFSAIVTLDGEALRSALVPLSETIISATPLILTGLSVALGVPRRPVQHRRRGAALHRRAVRE